MTTAGTTGGARQRVEDRRRVAVLGDWRLALALVAVAALAAAVRVLIWRWSVQSGAVPPGDPEEYYRAALHILQGGYHDTGKWLRPPGYPALLALLLSLAGMDVARALLLQSVALGAGTLAFYALGRQLFGAREGALAALIAALFLPLAAFGAAMYAEALFVTLMALALATLDRALVTGRRRCALAAGLLLGAATLTRALGLFFVPLAALWLFASPRRHEGRKENHENLVPSRLGGRDRHAAAALLLLGAALVIAPWTARNYAVHERLIVVDTNGGISMWWGAVRSPEEKAARDETLFAVPNLADRQALALRWTAERVAEDPATFLARARFKLASLFLLQTRSYAAGDVIAVSPAGEAVVQNAGELPLGPTLVADGQYVLVMLLGIAGLCFAPSTRRAVPTLLWVAVVCGLAALTIGHPRLRLPIVAALIPFAAYALVRLPVLLRRGSRATAGLELRAVRSRVGALLVGSLVFLALVASTRYVAWARAEWHALEARQRLEGEDFQAARRALERARATDPSNPLRTVALADLALREGRLAEADELFGAALDLEGRNLYSRAMRALLAPALGRPEAAARELAAFDEYWRVRDDLHQWAWRHAMAPPPTRLVPGDPAALGHYAGFAPATEDLAQGRWTLGDGRVRLAGSCGALVLRLQGPAGRDAAVEVEGLAPLRPVTLSGGPQEVRVAIGDAPGCAERQPIVARVRSDTGLLDVERAPWYAGVALLEAWVEE